MNQLLMPYMWEDGDFDDLEDSGERPGKRLWAEYGYYVAESHYPTVPVTLFVDLETFTYGEVRIVVLAHPLLKHLDNIDTGPPSPVENEDINKEDG